MAHAAGNDPGVGPTLGALPPPQRKDLRGLSLARNQSHDAAAPELEHGADLFWIGGQVIGTGDLVADGMAEHGLDDVRQGDAFVVHRRAAVAAQIVMRPSADAGARVEALFGPRPAGKTALTGAEYQGAAG